MQESPESTTSVYGAALPDSPTSSEQTFRPIQVSLIDDRGLWSQFSRLGTEMIITKSGRQMFPNVKLRLENLKPYAFYKVYMELAPVDNMRYKYERNNWMPRGTESTISSAWMQHPLSPAEGYKWMLKPVDFHVRLTNYMETANRTTMCLRSMYKYMIIIHVEEGSNTSERNLQQSRAFPLVKTTFIAVTTYQNPLVKELKTDTNIRAKGVRIKRLMQKCCENTKENFSETGKRLRSDTTVGSFYPREESPTSSEGTTPADTPTANATVTSSWSDPYHNPLEVMKRIHPLNLPDLPAYHRNQAPPIGEKIPLTTPLAVHCPPPYLHYERPPPCYNPFFPLYPQNFPYYQPQPPPPHGFLPPVNWPMFSTKVLSSKCDCRYGNCDLPLLNACPACRDNLLRLETSKNMEATDNSASSSSTSPDVSSSSQISHFAFTPSSSQESAISQRIVPESTVSSSPNGNSPSTLSEFSSSIADAINSSGSPRMHSAYEL